MIRHKSEKTKKLVYEFDERKLKGIYYAAPKCPFEAFSPKTRFRGFPRLPKGFSTDGYGFASPAGSYLANALRDGFGTRNLLTIAKNQPTSAHRTSNGWNITLNHGDYLRILDPLRDIRHERNVKSNAHVAHVLGQLFPKRFKEADQVPTIYTYEEDKLSKMLGTVDDAHELLSKADIDVIARLHEKLAAEEQVEFSSIGIAEESTRRNERIYLQSVVKEFRKRLNAPSLSEADWQRFLQKYVLLFNTSYVKAVEKLSVDLRGKYPDFLLINVYGYIDVYEIKKPTTPLLRHDDSRDNYYWDAEVAKAISQTEKYIQMLIRKALDIREIIREKHGVEVKVVRPRGFIVVGNSKQLADEKMNDDFRLLASSLKNVDIVLYDELLNNLENLLARLKQKNSTRQKRN